MTRISLLVPLLAAAACDRPQAPRPSKPPSAQPNDKASKGSPKIACAGATYDFGKVSEGDKVEHVFVIKNEGNGMLEIKRASAG